jgi:hypothetical protein
VKVFVCGRNGVGEAVGVAVAVGVVVAVGVLVRVAVNTFGVGDGPAVVGMTSKVSVGVRVGTLMVGVGVGVRSPEVNDRTTNPRQ